MDFGIGVVDRHWQSFRDEVDRWKDSGRDVDFWWRDDDACRFAPALSRLYSVATASRVPLSLAAIPATAEAAAFQALPPGVTVIQHGVDHRNRAEGEQKKTEFPVEELVEAALARLVAGRSRLQSIAGDRLVPVVAPPWNRIHAALAARLGASGYVGLSAYGPRKVALPGVGLIQANTHVDIIDWKGGRGFVGTEFALAQATRHLVARRTGTVDAEEPTGWLTHHAVHDEAAWSFLAELFEMTRGQGGIRWLSAREIFGVRN